MEAQNRIAEFRLRIGRKRGQWLLENIVQSGNGSNQYEQKELKSHRVTLATGAVTKMESSILQRIARIPEDEFEKHLETQQKAGEELTTASLLKLETALKFAHRKPMRRPEQSLDHWQERLILWLLKTWGNFERCREGIQRKRVLYLLDMAQNEA